MLIHDISFIPSFPPNRYRRRAGGTKVGTVTGGGPWGSGRGESEGGGVGGVQSRRVLSISSEKIFY